MKGILAAWVLAGILLALAVSPSVAGADNNVALWSPGDSWQWRGTLGPSGPFLLTMAVLNEESISVSGVSYSSYHVRLWNNLTSGAPNSSMVGDVWYRVSDLTPLKSIIEFNVSAAGAATWTYTITYDPPLPLHFPLVANDTWIATTTATVVATSPSYPTSWNNGTLTMTTKVAPSIQYTVLAGTFMTTPVNETFTSPQYGEHTLLYYWSSDVGNSVTGPSIAPAALDFGSMQLTSFQYTPPSAPSATPTPFPLWTFLAGVAVGAALVVIVVVVLFLRSRGPRKPKVREPEAPSLGPKV